MSLPLVPEYSIDRALGEKLLRRYLGDVDESRCRLSFDRYQRLLCDYLPQLPLYPATSLLRLAQLLPSLAQLEAARL